jgi:hypothetical protein
MLILSAASFHTSQASFSDFETHFAASKRSKEIQRYPGPRPDLRSKVAFLGNAADAESMNQAHDLSRQNAKNHRSHS